MARAPSTNVKAPKRVHAKPRKEAAKSYIPFKARVLAAVYRISKSKQKRPRTASSQAIKKHCELLSRLSSDARSSDHAESES